MIHPRRLTGTAGNIARYYSVGDYYTKGGDEHSEWGGKIAADLGLTGPVDPVIFRNLLAGRVGDQQLGRRRGAGVIEHHPGWDFSVNAPKSVSIMALVAGDERIVAAHERAVTTATEYLEEHASLRRRHNGEIVHETTGRLIFARFTEHASRELDPHLHTHVVVLNMTNPARDVSMASLETRAMFVEQMTAGQVYRNELAFGLRELGYDVEYDSRRGLFEIRGVPPDLIAAMSRRAEQIDAHAREHGLSGQAARRRSFYETRRGKDRIGLEGLREQWTARARPHAAALGAVQENATRSAARPLTVDPIVVARAALFGIRQPEGREAVNNLGRHLRTGLASDVGAVRLADIRPMIERHEESGKLLRAHAQTGDVIHVRGRATRRSARLEIMLSEHLSLGLNDGRPIAGRVAVMASAATAGLNPAQIEALLHAATSPDRITGIHGVAGAGKSTLIKALVDAADPGRSFISVAPTSSAAANLGQVAGIEARTVASLLASGGRHIDAAHILVIDESGQLGNRQAQRILELSRVTGARVLFLGDNRQTGAIEQGKAFWLLQRLGLPTAEITESVRQETRSMKAAVAAARIGDYAASLNHLDKVVTGADGDTLARSLVSEWTRLSSDSRSTTNILVLDNATRRVVNEQVRAALRREGALAAEDHRLQILASAGMTDLEKHYAKFYGVGQVVTFSRDIGAAGIARDVDYRVVGMARAANGRQVVRIIDENGRETRWDPRTARANQVNVFNREERDLAAGDRIQWRLVNRELDLRNAERGTLVSLAGTIATIRWDRGDRVHDVDLAKHRTWDHGYAETVYSAQSKTYARVYVLAPVNSALVTGQNYYTAITRARLGAKLWTEDAEKLVDRLTRHSGEKTSALEGLGRLDRDHHRARSGRNADGQAEARRLMLLERERRQTARAHPSDNHYRGTVGFALAAKAQALAERLDAFLQYILTSRRAVPEADRPEPRHTFPDQGHAR